jgi:hypothetical protein
MTTVPARACALPVSSIREVVVISKRACFVIVALSAAVVGTACDGLFGTSATVYEIRNFEANFDNRDQCIQQQLSSCLFTFQGTVVDEARVGVASAEVMVFDDDDKVLQNEETDAQGFFLTGAMMPTEGTWQVTVCAADKELHDPDDFGMWCMYAGQNYD